MKINSKHSRTLYYGDLHGEFRKLIFDLKTQKIEDALVIVLGDVSLGFHKYNYYVNIFNYMQSKLEKMNNTVIFFRGNHDDPKYFINSTLVYKNIIVAEDYSIINQNGVKSLIVGGGISIDRYDRIASGEKNVYWEDEMNHFTNEDWNKIKNEKDISIILTHIAPEHSWPLYKIMSDNDNKLIDDELKSRRILTNLLEKLIKNGNSIKEWYYGHYHEDNIDIIDNIKYRCVKMNSFYERRND